jgi:hypothetical protein
MAKSKPHGVKDFADQEREAGHDIPEVDYIASIMGSWRSSRPEDPHGRAVGIYQQRGSRSLLDE